VSRYDCHLTAYDGGSPARSASLHVAIQVTDVNDHSPRFDAGDVYTVTVPEDFPLHVPFLQVIRRRRRRRRTCLAGLSQRRLYIG